MSKIDCYISTYISNQDELIGNIENHKFINAVKRVGDTESANSQSYDISVESFYSTANLRQVSESSSADYILLITGESDIVFGVNMLDRFVSIAESTGAAILYSDYNDIKNGDIFSHPLIDYQEGSIRDDFNFGPLLFLRTDAVEWAFSELEESYNYGALYQLRLKISQKFEIFHIPELLYSIHELDLRASGKKSFDYLNPKNREVQIEMEQIALKHLKEIKAYLKPSFTSVDFNSQDFKIEASVIIPVRNREKTIAEAIDSVISQKTSFDFNLIIVDNHSSDRTTEIIRQYSTQHPYIIHIIPERKDLGIGGCWNLAVADELCGKFAVQLDSDDLYMDESTLGKIVAQFYIDNCAMVIASYQMTNFALEEIPPGIIDHREWTEENGRNNALRINGLGAPRAFYTPVLRDIQIPNTSFGEDYAVGLSISRNYKIGRIYKPLYLCRRWDDNSDASLSAEADNRHNFYKDNLRTIEIKARKIMNLKS